MNLVYSITAQSENRKFPVVYTTAYRFGFNGMETTNEIYGEGNEYSTEFRQYDARLGRWLSIDPLTEDFPESSPYVSFDNNPIILIDRKGLASEVANAGGLEKTPPLGERIAKAVDWVKNIFRGRKKLVPDKQDYLVTDPLRKIDPKAPLVRNGVTVNRQVNENYSFSSEVKTVSFNFEFQSFGGSTGNISVYRKNFWGREKLVYSNNIGAGVTNVNTPTFKANRFFVNNQNDGFRIVLTYTMPVIPPSVTTLPLPDGGTRVITLVTILPTNAYKMSTTQTIRVKSEYINMIQKSSKPPTNVTQLTID